MRIVFVFVLFNHLGYAQSNSVTYRWDTYVQPILDSIAEETNKKIIVSDFYHLDKGYGKRFESILQNDYGLSMEQWLNLWDVWRNNYSHNSAWKRKYSSEKRNKILKSKKWKKQKIEVIDVSTLIFLDRDTYVLGVTTYCPGICSSTDLYIVKIDRKTKELSIRYKLDNVIVS